MIHDRSENPDLSPSATDLIGNEPRPETVTKLKQENKLIYDDSALII